MLLLVKASDHAGVLGILASAENINSPMLGHDEAVFAITDCIGSIGGRGRDRGVVCAKRQIRPTREIFNNILGYLTATRTRPDLENVRRWLSRMRDAGIQPDTWACNILLKAMLLAGDWTAAAGLLSGMTHEHAAATAAAAAAIPTDGLPKTRRIRSTAATAATRMPPPADAVTFNTAISGLGIAHCLQQAEAVLNHMLDADLMPIRPPSQRPSRRTHERSGRPTVRARIIISSTGLPSRRPPSILSSASASRSLRPTTQQTRHTTYSPLPFYSLRACLSGPRARAHGE